MIFISGGGTGGHLFPALTISEHLMNIGYDITFIGSKHGMEANFLQNKNINIKLLDIYGIQRNFSLKSIYKNLFFPIKFIKSYVQSIQLIRELKPVIIIGTGGYSSGLPLLAAIHLKIPTLIQDQNSVPGLITRKLHKYINTICIAYSNFQISNNYNNIVLTGNPIRSNLKTRDRQNALIKLNLSPNKKTILVLGGSQGSKPINKHIINNIQYYLKNDIQIIWQSGEKNYNDIPKHIRDNENITVKKFYKDMSKVYSAADAVISRAGALAISELLFMGKIFILIPFKYAADNHQEINANYISNNKACLKINEDDLHQGVLEKHIYELLHNDKIIQNIKNNIKNINKPDATQKIINEVTKIIDRQNAK